MVPLTRTLLSLRLGRRGALAASDHALARRHRAFGTAAAAVNQDRNAVQGVNVGDRTITVTWGDGEQSDYHFMWMRHNCLCPQCLHPASKQKLITAADVRPETRPLAEPTVDQQGDALTVNWMADDGRQHSSSYPLTWLRSHCRKSPSRRIDRRADTEPKLWDGSIEGRVTCVDFEQYMDDDKALLKALQGLQDFGICFVRRAPVRDGMVRTIAERIGPIRNTFYGEHWEVKNEPSPENVAYSNLPLPLHTDLRYFESPPGLQLLHCLHAASKGGHTTFVDGYNVANRLRVKDPKAFATLSETPMTFIYTARDHERTYKHPLIKLGAAGQVEELHYSPPWEAPLDIDNDQMDEFYRAYRVFSDIANDPQLLLSVGIQPGDCVIFNNRRVLHGRTDFDASERRLLNGCYVDRCDFLSRLAVLRRPDTDAYPRSSSGKQE